MRGVVDWLEGDQGGQAVPALHHPADGDVYAEPLVVPLHPYAHPHGASPPRPTVIRTLSVSGQRERQRTPSLFHLSRVTPPSLPAVRPPLIVLSSCASFPMGIMSAIFLHGDFFACRGLAWRLVRSRHLFLLPLRCAGHLLLDHRVRDVRLFSTRRIKFYRRTY